MSDAAEFVSIAALSATPRVVVRFQAGRCRCGCEGTDYQHKERMPRTLREITPLDSPRPLPLADRPSREWVILATATARAPWGRDVEVWAVAYGSDPKFAEWEYSAMTR